MINNGRQPDSPTGLLFLGVSALAIAAYWSSVPDDMIGASKDLKVFFATMFGAIATFGGTMGVWRRYLIVQDRKATQINSGIYGTASFADLRDCKNHGLLDPDGLYLGLLDGQPLFYSGKAHLLTCAPARSGKGINVVIPNLLHYTGSVVVTDPKGELAAVTAAHRQACFGHRVIVFNPWGLHGLPQHRINPLQELIRLAATPAGQRGLADEAAAIALQLLPEPEDARNRFFRDGARSILRAGLLYLAVTAPERCTLPELWQLIYSASRLARMAAAMQESEALGGLLATLGDDLMSQIDDNGGQFADFRAGAVQALDIYQPGGYLGAAVSGSDIDLADVKRGGMSVYLAFPQDRIGSHGAALGLIVNQAITGVARSPEKGRALFLLDEFANLGRLSGLAQSLTALPGLGIRVFMLVQELAELTRLYGPHTTETILSQSEVKQFFAVNTADTAQKLSRALGQRTVKTSSFNLGRTIDDDVGESVSETGQPLLRPEDLLRMGPSEQLLLVKGMRPIWAQRIPFTYVAPWAGWAASNPVEGDYPPVKPLVKLSYKPRNAPKAGRRGR